jgi:putative permease
MNVLFEWVKTNLSDRQVVLLVGFLVFAFLFLYFFGNMLAPVLAAVVISFLLDGIVGKLTKRGVSHGLAVVFTFASFLVGSFLIFFAVLPPIAAQVVNFMNSLPEMISTVDQQADKLPELLPGIIDQEWVDSLMAAVQREILELAPRAVELAGSNIAGFIAFIVYAILVPVMVFFFMKDKDQILSWLGGFLPKDRPLSEQVWNEGIEKAAAYARGKVIEVVIVGLAGWVLLLMFDVPYAAFLAFITGLSVIVPYVGATVATIAVVVVAFAQWGFTGQAYLVTGLYIGLHILDGFVLVPWLFSKVAKLHPIAIILAILFFGGLWGFWGVFFAIPLATLANAVLRAWAQQSLAKKA